MDDLEEAQAKFLASYQENVRQLLAYNPGSVLSDVDVDLETGLMTLIAIAPTPERLAKHESGEEPITRDEQVWAKNMIETGLPYRVQGAY